MSTAGIHAFQFPESITQASGIQSIDCEGSHTTLCTPGPANQPVTRPAGSLIQRGVDDLHKFTIASWAPTTHSVSITQTGDAPVSVNCRDLLAIC